MVHSPHRSLMSPNDFTFASLNRDNPKTTSESEQQPPDHLRLTPTLRPTLAPDAAGAASARPLGGFPAALKVCFITQDIIIS